MAISLIIKKIFKVKEKQKKTGKYCGISKDPGARREELRKKFPTMYNFEVVAKFKNMQKAEKWRDAQDRL